MFDRSISTFITAASLAMLACARVQVTQELGSLDALDGLATYAQIVLDGEIPDGLASTPQTEERVHEEIDRRLQTLGYRRAEDEEADFRVSFLVNSVSEVRFVNAGEPETDFYEPRRFSTDTVVLTAFEARSGSPVWRASGEVETAVTGALILSDREQALLGAVREVLEAFPAAR